MSALDQLLAGDKKSPPSGLDALLAGGEKDMPSGLDAILGTSKKGDVTPEMVAASEAEQQATGAKTIPQDLLALGGGVIDIISRGNYASAAFVKEMLSGSGAPDATSAALNEILSGIGGFKGRKEGFGQVMEQAGVGQMGQLSDILPIYSETGEGAAFQRGGMFDPTGRGAVGLILDIVADPVTYLTAGTGKAAQIVGKAAKEARLLTLGEKTVTKALTAEGKGVLKTGLAAGMKDPAVLEGVARQAGVRAAEAQAEATLARSIGYESGRVATATEPFAGLGAAERVAAQQRALELSEAGALKHVADAETAKLIAAGIKDTDPLFTELRKAARAEAVQRLLVAAETNPGLLDRGGVKWMGLEIPGTRAAAVAVSGMSTKALAALKEVPAVRPVVMGLTKGSNDAYALVGRLFSRDFLVKNVPGMSSLKTQANDGERLILAKILDTVHGSDGFRQYSRLWKGKREAEGRAFLKEFEVGNIQALKGWQRDLADTSSPLLTEMALKEVEVQALNPERVRNNYWPRFYLNSPEEMRGYLTTVFPDRSWNLDELGRHNEIRVYDTAEEAIEVSTKLHANDPGIPILRPNFDLTDALVRRSTAHAKSVSWKSYLAQIRQRYSIPADIPDSAWAEMSPPAITGKLSAPQTAEYLKIQEAVGKGGTSLGVVKGLSAEGQREFFRQRFLKIADRDELFRVMDKYHEFADAFPKRLAPIIGDISADGSKYVAVRDISALTGRAIPQSIADDLARANKAMLHNPDTWALVKTWDSINNTFKTAVTILFPAFNFRNLYNNVGQAFLDIALGALDPRQHYHTVRILAGATGEMVTDLGEKYSYDEIRRVMQEAGVVIKGADVMQFTGQAQRLAKQSEALSTKLRDLPTTLRSAPRRISGAIENEARAQLFLNHLRRGSDINAAADRMKGVLVDYANLSDFERDYMRRAIPFYTWTRKNIAYQVDRLIHAPGLVAAEVKPFRGREDENGSMAMFDGRAFKFRLNRDGRSLQVLSGVDIPVRQLDLLWQGNVKQTLRTLEGMFAPPAKALIEIPTGTSLFTGRDMTRAQSGAIGRVVEHLPVSMPNWIGYQKETDSAGHPRYTFDGERFYAIFQSWVLSRVVSTTDRQFRYFTQGGAAPGAMLNVLTGLQYKDLNLTVEEQKRLNERYKQLQQVHLERGNRREKRIIYEPKR